MSKKVLILSGNSFENEFVESVYEKLMQGCSEVGNSIIKIDVSLQQLSYCKACVAGEQSQQCSIINGIDGIMEKMIEADIWVLATPVQVYTIDAFFRKINGHNGAYWDELHGKKIYYILFANEDNSAMKSITLNSFKGYLNRIDGAEEKETLYVVGMNQKWLNEAYQMGRLL